jgi:hypothetical protein
MSNASPSAQILGNITQKSTYKHLSEVLSAYWAGDRADDSLVDTLHASPRLTQWAKVAEGYRIWSTDEALSVTVTPEKIYTTKGIRVSDLQSGLPAQTLYHNINAAQAIVQANGHENEDEDYFAAGVEFDEGASLDAALEETHAAPLAEDDAELIEDVTAEQALDAEQKREDGPSPVLTVSQKFIEDLTVAPAVTHTEKINPKNATTDGVICGYCGNLNKQTYRGTCPQCPKAEKPKAAQEALAKDALVGRSTVSNLKSLQGRILTIIDASFADKEQRNAVKTMINKEFRREISKVGGEE